MALYYVDSSALLKLVLDEVGSPQMRTLFAAGDLWFTGDITRTEVPRALARLAPGLPSSERTTVLIGLALVELDRDIYDLAGRLQPARLRSLDAIHVAAALSLGSDLTAVVTYDERMAEAARLNGLSVLTPGVEPAR